jgi:flagellar motility protein MotE (MotC chaperone)
MSARITWIASLAALLLSLGVIFGMLSMRMESILVQLQPPVEEERFDPVSMIYWDRYFTHLYDLQKELEDERSTLRERAAQLDEKEEQLVRRGAELDQRSVALEQARQGIRQWFVSYGEAERANYQRIARTYAAMEPDKVVPILLATPSEEVAKILLEMRPETVAPIWTALLDASGQTEANAIRVSRLIDLMGRVHQNLSDPPEVPPAAAGAPRAAANPAVAGPAAGDPLFAAADPDRFSPREIENFQRVARTYEAMDPVKVAPILLATPPRNAAGVLLQMRPERVAPIWSAIIDASRAGEEATERVVAMAEFMRRNRNGV